MDSQTADALARKIIALDPAFHWVVLLDEAGGVLAQVYSESYTERTPVSKATQERLGAVDAVFLSAAAKAEKWYGQMEFILLAYRDAKVMLVYGKRDKLYLVAKVPRSTLAEHLFAKVSSVLG